MGLFDVASICSLQKAQIVGGLRTGLNDDAEVAIRYSCAIGVADEVESWLQTNRKTVRDTKVEFQKLDGVWRSVGITQENFSKDRKEVDIVQTFRKGFLTTILKDSAIDYTEARIVNAKELPAGNADGLTLAEARNPENYVLLRWEGIDPSKLETAKAEVAAISALNWAPTARGQSYGSGFFRLVVISDVREGTQDRDRSGFIDIILGKPRFNLEMWQRRGAPNEETIYRLYNTPKILTQSILNTYNRDVTFTSASADSGSETGLYNLTISTPTLDQDSEVVITGRSCTVKSTTYYFYNQSDTVDVPVGSSGVWYTTGQWGLNSFGAWDGFYVKHEQYHSVVSEFTATSASSGTTIEEQHHGVRDGDVDENGASVGIPGMTAEKGSFKRLTRRKNDNCTQDIIYEEQVPEDQESTDHEEDADKTVEVEKHTQNENEETLPASSPGTIVSVTNVPTEVGKYNTRKSTLIVKNQSSEDYEEDYSKSTVSEKNTEADDPITQPLVEQGTIKSVVNTPTQSGKTATRLTTITVKDQVSNDYEEDASKSTSINEHTESQAALTAPVYEQGYIRTNSNTPTPAGNYQTRAVVVSVKDQTSSDYEEDGAKTTSIEEHTENSTALTAPAYAQGTIKTNSNTPTQAGNFATRAVVVIVKDQTSTDADGDASKTTTVSKHTENSSALSVPVFAQGYIKANRNTPTQAGNFATQEIVTEVIDQESSDYDEDASKSTAVTEHTENASALTAPAYTQGYIKTNSNTPTQAGNYQTRAVVVTVKDQVSEDGEIDASRIVTIGKHTENSTALTAPSYTKGYIKENRNTPTQAGNFATQQIVTQVIDQESDDYEEDGAKSVSVSEHTENTAALTTPAYVQGTIRQVSNAPTRAGNFQTRDVSIVVKDQESTDYEEDASKSTVIAEHTENSTALTVPVYTKGVIQSASNTPTQSGNFGTRLVSVTVKDQETSDYEEDFSKSLSIAKHTENPTALSAPAEAKGYIKTSTNSPTQAGNFNTREVVIEVKDQESTDYEEDFVKSITTTEHTENPTALTAPTEAKGFIKVSQNKQTAAGNYATREIVVTVKDQESIDYEEDGAKTRTVTEHTENPTALTAPSWTAGYIKTNSNQQTAAGNYATREDVIEVKDQEATDTDDDYVRSIEVVKHTQKATEAAAAVATPGVVRMATSVPTEAGKFATRETTVTVKNQTHVELVDRHDQSADIDINTQAAAALAPGSAATGELLEQSSHVTEFGRYRTTERTTTAKPQTFTASYLSKSGIRTYTSLENATDAALTTATAGLNATFQNDVSGSKNAFGLNNAVLRSDNNIFGYIGTPGFDLGEWELEPIYFRQDNKWYEMKVYILHTDNMTDAIAFLCANKGGKRFAGVGRYSTGHTWRFDGRLIEAHRCEVTGV